MYPSPMTVNLNFFALEFEVLLLLPTVVSPRVCLVVGSHLLVEGCECLSVTPYKISTYFREYIFNYNSKCTYFKTNKFQK